MDNFFSKCSVRVSLSLSILSLTTSVAAQQVSVNPGNIAFGNVGVGSNNTQTVVIKNTTKRKIGIFQAGVTGTGYTISGITTPCPLSAGQSVSLRVTFTPPAPGTDSGVVSLVTQNWWKENRNGTSTSQVTLSGTGVSGGFIGASPQSVAFGNVMLGNSQTSPITVANSGTAGVNISGIALSNAAYGVSGLTPPVTLSAGQSITFNVIFTPLSAGAAPASLVISSDASNGQLSVPLSGTGVSPGQLGLSPATFDFGNVPTGTSASTKGTLTAVGSSITISSASSNSPEFVFSGLALPVTLADGQSLPFTVTFQPQVSGIASGTISVVSNASNSPANEALSGTGVAPAQHSVDLSWNASGSPDVVGYYVYRGARSGGPYEKLTPAAESSLSYSDTAVESGQTYYYVITAEDTGGVESAFSNEAKVLVPNP